MADSGLIAFGAAAFGALVGGMGSAVGSTWLQRRELIRTARVRMYDELLPQLTDRELTLPVLLEMGRRDGMSIVRLIAALHRNAAIAGRTESRLVADLRASWEALSRPASAREARRDEYGDEILPERPADEARLQAAVQALERHLEQKIR